jgi:copper chaperone CopZ
MRTFLILALFAFTILFIAGCATTQSNSNGGVALRDDDTAIDAPSATLVVHGLSCPLCAHNIDQQLMRVRGVDSVMTDLGEGEVYLGLAESPKPTRAQLARAINEAGFTLVSIRTPND